MTLSTTTSRVQYPGTGSVGPYAVPFRVLSATDLRVIVRDAGGVETELAYPTDFTVAGVGNAAATVTLAVALAIGESLAIIRAPALTQPTSIRNQGTYFPATHEDEFDRLVMQIQSLQDQLNRSFAVTEGLDPAALALRLTPRTGEVLTWQSSTELGSSPIVTANGVALPGEGRTVPTLTAYLLNNRVWNIKDYGAVMNGVADDSAVLQSCINTATTFGGRVRIPAGPCAIANGITVNGSVTIEGDGGPGDTDGGFCTVPQTHLIYSGAGVAITIIGDPVQGIKNVHLRNFMLTGNALATGGILVGTGSTGSQQVNHSSIKDVTVVGFTKATGAGGYGFSFRRMLTSTMDNCIARACYDGFRFPNDSITTTLQFNNCHGNGCTRNALRFDNPSLSASSRFLGFVAESCGAAGVYIDGGTFVSFYELYCEANNLTSGAAPVMVLGSLGNPSVGIRFISPHIVDPVSNQRAFDFDRASQCLIFFPTLEFAVSNWCAVTANTANCVAFLADDLAPSLVTGNNTGRMAIHRPASRSSRSGATAGVTDGATITHGLGITPVMVRATPSVAGEMVSVTALGVTTFTVAIRKHDGTAGTSQTIYWQAEL